MYNDKETLSASEINRYTYCPYQWYYERFYGRKELRRLEKERNQRLGLEDSRMSQFVRGIDYHNQVRFSNTGRKVLLLIFLLLIAAVIVYFQVIK